MSICAVGCDETYIVIVIISIIILLAKGEGRGGK